MKILFLTPILPYPLDNGGAQGTLHVLNMFRKKDNLIKIISFADSQEQLGLNKRKLNKQIIIERAILNIGLNTQNHISKITTFIKSFFNLTPFTILKYYSKTMEIAVQNALTQSDYDLIVTNYIGMVQYVERYEKIRKIFFSHNLDSELYKGMAKYDFSLKWRIFGLLEWIKYILYEKRIYSQFKEIYSVGLKDIDNVKLLAPKATVKTFIPILKYPKIKRKVIPNTLLFIGSLLWYPNRDGMYWFLKKVFPLVLSKNPKVQIWVVGKLPKHQIFPKHKNIHYFGYQKDLTKYLNKTKLFIVPLRYGSGIHLKILQAQSAKIPIVATPEALKGLPFEVNNENVSDSIQHDFAKVIIRLLSH